MRAILLQNGQVSYQSSYQPQPPLAGEIPIRVLTAGLCETDLQLARGYMGFQGVLGHEFVGLAESGVFAGQRVVGEINCSCHACATCLQGAARHCPQRSVLGILGRDGAFADRVWLPQRNLHAVPENIPTWQAVFTEPLAAAFRIPEQLPQIVGWKTVILGDGRLGNLCAQVLRKLGNQVTVVGKHPRKLEILRRLGMHTCLAHEAAGLSRVPLVVDCTGSASGLPSALALVEPQGIVVLKTTIAGPHQTPLAPVVIDEVTLVGSRCGPFEPALRALAAGEIELDLLVEATIPLPETPAAISRAATSPLLKILIDVTGSRGGAAST